MRDTRRRQYLEAMGISTWSPRESAPSTAEVPVPTPKEHKAEAPQAEMGVKLGPGRDGILLVCASADEPASRLANDIVRALGAVPVWAWPEAGGEAVSIESAVEENLFTEVAVFGDDLAASLFSGEVPAKVGSASVVRLPSLASVREQAASRQALWNALCRSGMVNPER